MARHGLRLAAALIAVSLLATLAFASATIVSRPLENTEGCLLFEATRIRAGFPLYADPVVGAHDYGPVPARYHVLYPPLWSHLLALVPAASAAPVGRGLCAFLWFGVLGWIAWGAHARGRPAGLFAAAFVGGVYTLTLYGASARPDSCAVALAAVALERSVRAKKTGAMAAGMFALASWVKPNVIGLGAGAMASQISAPLRVALGWTGVSAVIASFLHHTSGGQSWDHFIAATLQPFTLARWSEQVASRLPFFATLIGFALYVGVSGRFDRGVRVATFSLATSAAWTLASLAKVGSTTCYWMEPCLGAVVVLSHAPLPGFSPRMKSVLGVIAPLQALWTGVASVRSSFESILDSPAEARALAELGATLANGSLWLSDDAGVELMLDGRLVDTPFQTTALVRAGRFPEDVWIADVVSPEVAGVIMTSDLLERPLSEVDPGNDRYDVAMRRVLRERFPLARRSAGYYVHLRSPAPSTE